MNNPGEALRHESFETASSQDAYRNRDFQTVNKRRATTIETFTVVVRLPHHVFAHQGRGLLVIVPAILAAIVKRRRRTTIRHAQGVPS
jgi:hypothetical protein